MARVNPPSQKVPTDIAEKFPAFFKWMQEEQFQKYQEWVRTGGGDDLIEGIDSSETYETSTSAGETNAKFNEVEQIEDEIPKIIIRKFKSVPATVNYTAVDMDKVSATLTARITLDVNAEVDAEIITTNGDGSLINVSGDSVDLHYKGKVGRDINLRNEGTSIHWYLFETDTDRYWLAS